jgi:hypothetical protein
MGKDSIFRFQNFLFKDNTCGGKQTKTKNPPRRHRAAEKSKRKRGLLKCGRFGFPQAICQFGAYAALTEATENTE